MESTPFLWRRLQITLRMLVFLVPAYLLNVSLLAIMFVSQLPLASVGLWAFLSTVVALGWWAAAWMLRHPSSARQMRRTTFVIAAFALTESLLYSWFVAMTLSPSPGPGQQVLSSVSIALACLGSIALSPLPAVSVAWLVGIFAGMFHTLLTVGSWGTVANWCLLLSLAVVLFLIVLTYRQLFQKRIRAEIQAARQTEMLGMLLHDFETDGQDWFWETDPEGRLKRPSARLAQLVDKTPGELEGERLFSLLNEDGSHQTVQDEEDLATLATCFAETRPFRDLEVPVQGFHQHRRWKLSGKPTYDAEGALVGWRGIGSDITEVQRLNNLNARLALLDPLTGLANRNRLQAVLHDHLSPRHGDRPCGLILIDLQGFRMVNEGLGHEVGDNLLRAVAQRLRTTVPSSVLLARLGGDEFALVAPGAGEEALEGLVSAVASVCEDPVLVDDHRLEIAFHVGLASFPMDAPSAAELLKCAQLALSEAKRHRPGQVVPYLRAFGDQARDRIRLRGELKIALIESQFELHYQPQIRLSDGRMVGSEALVRWRHPGRGLVSPAEFIPALEETGLIVPVGIWILETACREALTWTQDQSVAVNVSAMQFASRTFFDSVCGVLAATGFPASRLELEITESVVAQDPRQVVQLLQDLRNLGISVALDDFGTGFSSLSYLRQLPLDKLKVDQSFVRVLGHGDADAIVQTVLTLSKTLGLKTTAEGVETESQLALLKTMGCDSVQGYFYAKPLPPDTLQEFAAKNLATRS